MATKRRIVSTTLLLAVLSAFAYFLLRAPKMPEPAYNGKPISYWIYQTYITIGDDEMFSVLGRVAGTTNEDIKSPRVLDSKAVPFLLKAVQKRESSIHKLYAKLFMKNLRMIPAWLGKHLPDPFDARDAKADAAVLLARTGPASTETLQALIALSSSDDDAIVRSAAIDSLGKIGRHDPLVSQALIARLKDTNSMVRTFAADILMEIDPAAAARAGIK